MKNIILTGFMGTGKSSVGQLVAKILSLPFIDIDTLIEHRAGKTIPEIFAQDGEPAFRTIESVICHELANQDRQVIATGGGALVNPQNLAAFLPSDWVICLSCTVDTLLTRVASPQAPERPLLSVNNRRMTAKKLLDSRKMAYTSIPWQIDTTDLTLEETADKVIAITQALTLPVHHPNGEYPVIIGSGLLDQVGGVLRSNGAAYSSRVAMVVNPTVEGLYASQAARSLRLSGLQPLLCRIPEGEENKTLDTISALYTQFLDLGLERGDTVLALGGGVTGDMAGFASATYLRGIRFIQIPTTLLSMADASVGGKTGVDLPQGKNLVGAFKQPAAVLIDPTVLSTLPAAELRSGLAEVIKHCWISDPVMLEELESASGELSNWWQGQQASQWIARTVQVKIDIIEQDPYETGRRAVLNLGHTLGHALEKVSHFRLRHGEAVALGMIAAAQLSLRLSLASPELPERMRSVFTRWGLPTQISRSLNPDDLIQATTFDKKKNGKKVHWVLPFAPGNVQIGFEIDLDHLRQVISLMQDRS